MAEVDTTGFAAELGEQLEALRESVARELPGVDWSPMVLFGQVAALANLLHAFYQRLLADMELTRSEQAVLGILRGGIADAPGDLARITQQTAAGMTRTVDRLEARGLVTRRAHPSDRRKLRVVLSEEGVALAEAMLRAEVAAQHELLAGLDAKQRAGLAAALETLVDRLAPAHSGRAGRSASSS
ncbi:MAG: MarR family transcriptional regulator [Deltaproteobacteria bacterium]|nr:MarR family transcriptional regulator [Deltaproteobacteria bacterium]MBW2362088.1 MarR family transcriptional regulator [Deltaproteobacteria bacterium]